MHKSSRLNRGRLVVTTALSFGLALSQAPVALADDGSTKDIKKLTEEITQLYIEAEQSQYDLITVQQRLGKTEELIGELDAKIEETDQKLKVAKEELSEFVSNDYKQGTASLLDIILNSRSFEDFVSRLVYANKVAQHQSETINTVDSLYAELTQHKTDLEKAKSDQEQYIAEEQQRSAQAQQADAVAQAFIQQLPEDVVMQLASADAEQREAAAAASLQILASMDKSQLEATFGSEVANALTSGDIASIAGSGSSAGSSSKSGSGASSTASALGSMLSSGSTSATYSGASDLLSRVYSLLGAGYQWSGYNYTGDNSTSSFTCSGVVDYALGRDSRSSSPETLYQEVGSNITTDVSSLQAGDLVFYSYGGRQVGHVGVYVGDGQVIDSIPNGGVAVRDVNYMNVVGGGSLGSSSSSSSGSSSSYSDYSSSTSY